MSKQANPTLIGGFVVVAAVIAIVVVLVLSGGRLWAKTRHFVVVFEGSLHGLSVGAPVTFRGVPMGQVVDITPIMIMRDGEPAGLDVLVTLELQRRQLRTSIGETIDTERYSDAEVAEFYDRSGVRAQLALQSVLTGQLYVDLDFYPESPLKKVDVKAPYPQLATIETGLKKLGKSIESLPIDQLAHQALSGDDNIGLLLPCNVVVTQDGSDSEVAIVRPEAMFRTVDTPEVKPIADQAESLLKAVLDAI